jgi:hypothetical protein
MNNMTPSGHLHAVQWPSINQAGTQGIRRHLRGLVSRALLTHCAIVLVILAAYIAILNLPAIFSPQPFAQMEERLWWPLKLFLLFGTGGAIYRPGFASVGLLGGLFLLNRIHRAVQHGVPPSDVIRDPFNLILTFFVSALVVLLYAALQDGAGLPTLALFFASAFSGSLLIQLLNAQLHQRTGASLLDVNVLLAFYQLLRNSGLSLLVECLIGGVVLVCLAVMLVRMATPKMVLMDTGEPPRQGVLVAFPRIDIRWANLLSIMGIILAAIGNALWNLLFPEGSGVNPLIVFVVAAVIGLGAIEGLYRLNKYTGLITELDPILMTRLMLRKYWVLRDVEPGLPTVRFFERIEAYSQRWSMLILIAGWSLTGALVLRASGADMRTGIVVIIVAFLIVSFARFSYSVASSMYRVFELAGQQIEMPWRTRSTSVTQLHSINDPSSSLWTVERSLRLSEALLNYLARNEAERQLLRKLLGESDVLNSTNPVTVVRKTLDIASSIDKAQEEEIIQSTLTTGSAVKIILKNLMELSLSIILTIIFFALGKMIFGISQENIILSLLGAMAALIPILVGIMVKKVTFRFAVSTLFSNLFNGKIKSH